MHVKIRFRVAISDGPIVLGEFPGLTKTTWRLRSGIIIVCCSRFFCGTIYPFLLDHAIYENLCAQNIVHTSKIRFYVHSCCKFFSVSDRLYVSLNFPQISKLLSCRSFTNIFIT